MIFELCYIEAITTNRIPKNGLIFEVNFEYSNLQGQNGCLFNFRILQVRAESPMEHPAQGKRSDTLGPPYWSSRALKGQKH